MTALKWTRGQVRSAPDEARVAPELAVERSRRHAGMEQPQLDAAPDPLVEAHRSPTGSGRPPAPPPAGRRPRVLDHELLQVGGGDPIDTCASSTAPMTSS
jgi:hypothetical protein